MSKVATFLWFDQEAEEAAQFYVSIVRNSKITNVNRRDGKVFLVSFELDGQRFMALNGGPHFKFTEAISLFVNCETQAEVDELWTRLSAGGSEGRCGWLKDKYGLSWQIVPEALGRLMGDPDPQRAKAVFDAMMKMNKLVIADLEKAHASKSAA